MMECPYCKEIALPERGGECYDCGFITDMGVDYANHMDITGIPAGRDVQSIIRLIRQPRFFTE